ncbi:DUF5719 family protein [Agrococcus jejuensis]|uniref:Uncharacterized protein n=1 Tax=Agrococcus jejuensis TaxID=399736 RepID=A0A1G8FJH6_9MICO|nr:DUF5719 family protein [Agrococcus jejuensis]SDH82268.1 hypothetical protein SAMN04489720_2500 [Agrococcus jejuensis]
MSDDRTAPDEHGDEPVEETPAEAAAEQAPSEDAPAHDAPIDETSADDPSTEETRGDDADEPTVDLATDVTATDREAAAIEAAERARGVEPRSVGLWGLRATAGVAVVALGLLGVVAAPSLPMVQADPRIASVAPDAPEEVRTCAGPLLAIGDASGDAGAIGVLAQAQLQAASDEQDAASVAGVDATATVLRGTDVSGAEWLSVDDDTAFGAAASACVEPATTQWLVGGSTTTGRSSVLTIANPGTTATSVDVEVHGTDGRIDAVGSTGIAIAAGSVVLVDLASLAPGVASPVVHVTSTGGPVSAHLQHRVVRTLQPGGVDVVDPSQASRSIAIPGVTIGDATGLQTQAGFEDAVPALRVLAGESTQVTITTISDGGDPIASTLDLVGDQVSEVDLSGLAPGTYAFTIESDVPIVAAARQIRVDGDRIDLDWVQGQSAPIEGSTTVAIAAGPSPRLHLLNVGDDPQTVTIGGGFEVVVAPDELATVEVGGGVTTTIEADDVVAAVTYAGSEGIGGYAITPRIAAREGIDVVL